MSFNITARCRLIQALIDEMIDELEDRPLVPLKDVKPSRSAGAYLLYSIDVYGEYAVWALAGIPLYSGKTSDMVDRLGQHGESITHAMNLDINHFMVKYIELPEEFSHLSCMFEAAMLKRYEPFWNGSMTGFGLKDVGIKRADSKISDWDTMHPGRPNRGQTPNNKTPKELSQAIKAASRALARRHLSPTAEGLGGETAAVEVSVTSVEPETPAPLDNLPPVSIGGFGEHSVFNNSPSEVDKHIRNEVAA